MVPEKDLKTSPSAIREAIPIVLHHHEHFAGNGYPYGLRGTEIPLPRSARSVSRLSKRVG